MDRTVKSLQGAAGGTGAAAVVIWLWSAFFPDKPMDPYVATIIATGLVWLANRVISALGKDA